MNIFEGKGMIYYEDSNFWNFKGTNMDIDL
jgi:hypothetical protein